MAARRFIIVSGVSGGGKTIALHALEDAGFYCVDNLPAGFLDDFARFIGGSPSVSMPATARTTSRSCPRSSTASRRAKPRSNSCSSMRRTRR